MINPVHVEYKKSRYPSRNCHDGQEKEEETGENRRESIATWGAGGERSAGSWQSIERRTINIRRPAFCWPYIYIQQDVKNLIS